MGMFSPHAIRVDPQFTELIRTLIGYHNSGAYKSDLEVIGKQALAYVKKLPARGKQRAMTFDIDETSLANDWPQLVDPVNETYRPDAWAAWIAAAAAPAIAPTLAVFNAAREKGIEIFFITGRHPPQKKVTEKNLLRVGYKGWKEIIMEPMQSADGAVPLFPTALSFKSAARWSLIERGYRIVMNIGDQVSDLQGGYADQTFKLPNPFYIVL